MTTLRLSPSLGRSSPVATPAISIARALLASRCLASCPDPRFGAIPMHRVARANDDHRLSSCSLQGEDDLREPAKGADHALVFCHDHLNPLWNGDSLRGWNMTNRDLCSSG